MSATKQAIEEGYEHIVQYPFVRETIETPVFDEFDIWTLKESLTWRPGVRFEQHDANCDADTIADALGRMRLRVIAVVKPGKYPERVFYTRQWQDPDGKLFGKTNLRMTTTQNFRVLLRGYRHEYDLQEPS